MRSIIHARSIEASEHHLAALAHLIAERFEPRPEFIRRAFAIPFGTHIDGKLSRPHLSQSCEHFEFDAFRFDLHEVVAVVPIIASVIGERDDADAPGSGDGPVVGLKKRMLDAARRQVEGHVRRSVIEAAIGYCGVAEGGEIPPGAAQICFIWLEGVNFAGKGCGSEGEPADIGTAIDDQVAMLNLAAAEVISHFGARPESNLRELAGL